MFNIINSFLKGLLKLKHIDKSILKLYVLIHLVILKLTYLDLFKCNCRLLLSHKSFTKLNKYKLFLINHYNF